MSTFSLYFNLGVTHILDLRGFDHILFIIALCSLYTLRDWRKVLIMVTAFTIGHSITLALATLNIIRVNAAVIEFLIPVTIFITALTNILRQRRVPGPGILQVNYGFALFFGLIHGLGFSSYLRSLLGQDKTIVPQLLAFNLGLEFGQIVIVLIFLVISSIVVGIAGVARRDWKLIISSAVAGIALTLIWAARFW